MTEPVGLVTKLSMMLVSLLLSFGLWMYVQYTQPEGWGTKDVPIAAVNTESESSRYVFPDLGYAAVRVDGPQDQLKDEASINKVLKDNRVTAWIDFTGAQPGVHNYPIRLSWLHDSAFTFSLIKNIMAVDIEPRLMRRLPVSIDATGEIPRELNLSYDGASADPNVVLIDGPTTAVRRVKRVRAFLDLGTVGEGGTTEVSLDTLDENDQPVTGVTVSPQAVTIKPKVAPAAQSTTVFVEPIFQGHPAIGYAMTDYSVEPTEIALQGPPELLANLRRVSTKPISLDGLRSTTTFEEALQVPPGTKSYSTQSVKVIVTVEPSKSSPVANPSVAGPQ